MEDCTGAIVLNYPMTTFNNQLRLYVSMLTDIDLGKHDYPVLEAQIPNGFTQVFRRIRDATSRTAVWFSLDEMESYRTGSFQFIVD